NWLSDEWRATLYAQFYDWHMFSNATYDIDGQIKQFDKRETIGGRYEKNLFSSDEFEIIIGSEFRYDHIGEVGLDSTLDRQYISNISNNAIDESSIGLYSEARWQPIQDLRFAAGVRDDLYHFDVRVHSNAGETTASGTECDHIYSPKLGAAYAFSPQVEIYANWGKGFHSNDARGVVQKEDPVPGLVQGTGYEGGARFEVGTFKISAAYWWLNLSSELIFVGDDNTVEPKGGSKRQGYELVTFWRPVSWLGIDAVYTGSQARSTDPEEAGGKYIEGGVENAGEIGISAVKNDWEFSARLRYLGPYPLVPDNSVRADSESMLNIRLAHDFDHVTLYGEVLNVLDHKGKDIVYFYENAFDSSGGRVSRAEEPRSVRLGLKYKL
ncbi:MAG: TonB-dependent receptor, partial [Moraxellaceae bacterium]